MTYRPEIDGLRAIAVLAVFAFHLGWKKFAGGFVGVDVFFVISGYLITSIIQRDLDQNRFSIFRFYDRRFRRIIPALYFMLIGSAIFTWKYFMPQEMRSFCSSLFSTLLFYSNFHFLRQSGYFDLDSEMKPLLHTWSLSIEEQFYVIYPTLLFVSYRIFRSRSKLLIVGLAIISFVYNIYLTEVKQDLGFYFSPGRAWELLLGALLALGAVPKMENRRISEALGWIGLSMIGYSVIAFSAETTFPGYNAAIPCIGTALIIYGSHNAKGLWITKFLSTNVMTSIGKISYSLYLWHWPLIVFAKYYLVRRLTLWDEVGIIAATFLAAILSWRFIEHPFRERKSVFAYSKVLAFAMILVTTGFAYYSHLGATRKGGYPRRLPKNVRHYTNATRDRNPETSKCHTIPLSRIRKGELCHVGDSSVSAPQFAVWGDSFTNAIIPGLKEAATTKGVFGVYSSSSGCGPVLGFDRKIGAKKFRCGAFNEAMADAIKTKGIKRVLLVSAWAPSGYVPETSNDDTKEVVPVSSERHSQRDISRFYAGFERLLKRLTGDGVEIWIVGKIPDPDFHVPSYLGRYELFQKDKRALQIDRAVFEKQRATFDQIISLLQRSYPFHFIDPSSALCKEKCLVEFDGTPLYRDRSHLSGFGSKYVMTALDPFFTVLRATRTTNVDAKLVRSSPPLN